MTASTAGSLADHPKHRLYDGVYDPLTEAWFAALAVSPDVPRLLREATEHPLLVNLRRLDDLFRRLVDECIGQQHEKVLHDTLTTVARHRDAVTWMGYMVPAPDATLAEIKSSLSHKLKRNISLGAVEALICLESAYAYGRDELHLGGAALADTLRRSSQLYASLAVLHDEQERERLTELTGVEGFLEYPEVDYHDVVPDEAGERRVRIAPDKFTTTGSGDELRIKLVITPVRRDTLSSPVKRCPAHRLPSPKTPGHNLNDDLWDLLIRIYERSGRFA